MRGRHALYAAGLFALGIAGCVALVRSTVEREPPRFDHSRHLRRGLACADCHAGASAAGERAGMPEGSFCLECHDAAGDRERPSWAGVREYGSRPAQARFARAPSYADVVFPHDRHTAASGAALACAACHPGIAQRGAPATPAGPMSMERCMACHEQQGAPNDCTTCHERLDRERRPDDHHPGWIRDHGPLIRVAGERTLAKEQRCDICHTRASCDDCHASQPPRDHGVAFRNSTHGLAAAMDRSRCITCHRVDSCERCHSLEPPRSHRPGFGAPANRHCLGCHLPVGSEGCVTCHKATPSHDSAPVKPPLSFHATARSPGECLSCHRRVSHPVGADDCNACHR